VIADGLCEKEQNSYEAVDVGSLSPQRRRILVEKHLSSLQHIQEPEDRALVVRDDMSVSVMVNEEDHFRIQAMTAGFNLAGAWEVADRVDSAMESNFEFAFNEDLGYLTSCPTNLGTGMRASVMLHLPALVLLQQINRIVSASVQLGMAVRGFYGEGTDAAGNVFQVSNQQTLGFTEQELIHNVEGVARQIVEQERMARRVLLRDSGDELADRVWRSYGVLCHARTISGGETLGLLSALRLGIDMGIIPHLSASLCTELLIKTRSSLVEEAAGGNDMEKGARNKLRADIIRETIKGGQQGV
jgi:protein arginine kinase